MVKISELFTFGEILLPIFVVFATSILITIMTTKNLGGFLGSAALIIGLLVWLGYFGDEFLAISALFIALSLYMGLSGVVSSE